MGISKSKGDRYDHPFFPQKYRLPDENGIRKIRWSIIPIIRITFQSYTPNALRIPRTTLVNGVIIYKFGVFARLKASSTIWHTTSPCAGT